MSGRVDRANKHWSPLSDTFSLKQGFKVKFKSKIYKVFLTEDCKVILIYLLLFLFYFTLWKDLVDNLVRTRAKAKARGPNCILCGSLELDMY